MADEAATPERGKQPLLRGFEPERFHHRAPFQVLGLNVAAHLVEHWTGESLTEREIDVLRQIVEGNRNKDIAGRLFISEETVKVHIRHIMEKLGASDRTQAVTIAARRGIIEL